MKLALDHVALPMYDVPATRAFYEESLGLELVSAYSGDDWDGKPWLMMVFGDAGGRQVALCGFRGLRRAREAIPPDARHYALAATAGELGAWKKRLRGAGVVLREEDHGTQRSIYFDDPNGNTLEITSPPTPKVAKRQRGAAKVIEDWLYQSRATRKTE
jgi:glyoxylase I family protein